MRSQTSSAGRVRSIVLEVSVAAKGRDVGVVPRSGCTAHPASAAAITSTNSRRQFMGGSSKVIFPFSQTGEDIDFSGQVVSGILAGTLCHPGYCGTQKWVGIHF